MVASHVTRDDLQQQCSATQHCNVGTMLQRFVELKIVRIPLSNVSFKPPIEYGVGKVLRWSKILSIVCMTYKIKK